MTVLSGFEMAEKEGVDVHFAQGLVSLVVAA